MHELKSDYNVHPIRPLSSLVLCGSRVDPYKPASIERLNASYLTEQTARVDRGQTSSLYPGLSNFNKPKFNVPLREAFFLPVDAAKQEHAWAQLQGLHQDLSVSLNAIALKLQSMGRYAERLEQAGDDAPNPLNAEVVIAEDPHDIRWGTECLGEWHPSAISKVAVLRHTPRKIELATGGMKLQSGKFCCQGNDWEELQQLQRLADARADAIAAFFKAPTSWKEPAQEIALTEQQIKTAALALPEDRRQRLVMALLQSLPPDIDSIESAGVCASKNFTGWLEEQREGKEAYFRYRVGGSRKSKKLKSKAEILLVQKLKHHRHPWEKTLAALGNFLGDAQATVDRLHESGFLTAIESAEIISFHGMEKKKVDILTVLKER